MCSFLKEVAEGPKGCSAHQMAGISGRFLVSFASFLFITVYATAIIVPKCDPNVILSGKCLFNQTSRWSPPRHFARLGPFIFSSDANVIVCSALLRFSAYILMHFAFC